MQFTFCCLSLLLVQQGFCDLVTEPPAYNVTYQQFAKDIGLNQRIHYIGACYPTDTGAKIRLDEEVAGFGLVDGESFVTNGTHRLVGDSTLPWYNQLADVGLLVFATQELVEEFQNREVIGRPTNYEIDEVHSQEVYFVPVGSHNEL